MARYIIERTLPKMSQEEMQQLGRRSLEVANRIPGVLWIKSYISEAEGKTYCEYEAPNPECLLEHARLLNISADKITRVDMEVRPAMFR